MSDEKPARDESDKPFCLVGEPAPLEKQPAPVEPRQKQRTLIDGLDCLPGQLDLF